MQIADRNYKLRLYQESSRKRHISAAADVDSSLWYRYAPLQNRHIRLLHLEPRSDNDALAFSLTLHSLDGPLPEYEALSYTWGDASETHNVACSGEAGGEGLLQITGNLFKALRRLRGKGRRLVLWVDAVCINQGDVGERSAQVQLMGDIYRSAASVVVWLGESANDSSVAFALARRLCAAAAATPLGDRDRPLDSDGELAALGLPAWTAPDWKSLDVLFWRPWFTRIWVVQEICLAWSATVYCGADEIAWRDLALAVRYFEVRNIGRHVSIDAINMHSMDRVRFRMRPDEWGHPEAASQPPPPLSLNFLLRQFRNSLATQPVDKVYAMLGLAADGGDFVVPDYSKPVAEVYRELARSLLEQSQSLEVLSLVGDPMWKGVDGLPSWVPDWSTMMRERPYLVSAVALACNASPPLPVTGRAAVGFSGDGTRLQLEGVLLDRVRRAGSPSVINPNRPGLMPLSSRIKWVASLARERKEKTRAADMLTWERLVLDMGERYAATGEDMGTVFLRTLVADTWEVSAGDGALRGGEADNEVATTDKSAILAGAYAAYRQVYMYWHSGTTLTPAVENAAYNYNIAVIRASFQRRLIITERRGLVGLGPRSTKVGDCVVLFRGGKTAYVLRECPSKSPGGSGCYEFIGESYVHGMMAGEGFAGSPDLRCFEIV
ncbi:hypothetical protein GGTG_09929 [Gaeumannomyces tritici R3-111a-1]|uniref:Heterokaryon incompatibility domain-containing protein n=1 Tax=Gaeumannomyces tritici (strain R3-111a-1) TaxID=644352 RepID=J3P8U5_GAET3|nr:hypothetical protein GGTG_09929 [Gaeumannomyces tritici R3-111a-1]EJT73079.1 hypothetical protein GGTG_09929 [Gaeumannomyces tritici R3-111a-1]